jgi:hypothetical protein
MAKRTPDSQELETTIEVMKALGGVKSVSLLTGSRYSATENWSRARTFPARYFLVMIAALKREGRSAKPELWGQVVPSAAQRRSA